MHRVRRTHQHGIAIREQHNGQIGVVTGNKLHGVKTVLVLPFDISNNRHRIDVLKYLHKFRRRRDDLHPELQEVENRGKIFDARLAVSDDCNDALVGGGNATREATILRDCLMCDHVHGSSAFCERPRRYWAGFTWS